MEYLVISLKAILTYFLMLVFIKVVGKAGFAQLTPYDLTFVIIIAAVLAAPLTDPKTSYKFAFVVFIIGLVMQMLISRLSLKDRIRPFVENKPTVIILDGNIIKENMVKTQFDMVQLLAALRLKDVKNIAEVELGTLEPSGEFSVITKSQKKEQNTAKSTYLSLKENTLKSLEKNRQSP